MDPLVPLPLPPEGQDDQRSDRSPVWPRFKRWVTGALEERNPFYLLSAACMLGGCLLLTNSVSWSPIPFPRLMWLFAAISVYELLLWGLGLYLAATSAGDAFRRRDAAQVLALAAVFMADAAFLVSEIVTRSLPLGAAISAVLLLLALFKAGVACRVLGVRLGAGRWGVVAGMLTALFGFPVYLQVVGDTVVHGGHLYAGWWLAALLWAAWDVVSRTPSRDRRSAGAGWISPTSLPPMSVDPDTGSGSGASSPVAGRDGSETAIPPHPVLAPAMMFVVIPWVSLLTHLGILHYVYDRAFNASHAAPTLLALSLIVARLPRPKDFDARALCGVVQWGLILVAVGVSGRSRPELTWVLTQSLVLTPWSLALAGAYLAAAWTHLPPRRFAVAVVAGTLAAIAYTVGPSGAQVGGWFSWAWSMLADASRAVWSAVRGVADLLWSLVPRTPQGWGAVAVTASFALLALGARVSLKRRPPADA
jgi:hypothetical protein